MVMDMAICCLRLHAAVPGCDATDGELPDTIVNNNINANDFFLRMPGPSLPNGSLPTNRKKGIWKDTPTEINQLSFNKPKLVLPDCVIFFRGTHLVS